MIKNENENRTLTLTVWQRSQLLQIVEQGRGPAWKMRLFFGLLDKLAFDAETAEVIGLVEGQGYRNERAARELPPFAVELTPRELEVLQELVSAVEQSMAQAGGGAGWPVWYGREVVDLIEQLGLVELLEPPQQEG